MSHEAPNTGGRAPRTVTIRLRLPVFITMLVLLLAGLAWIFVLGVLVGRGYNTRENIGPLAVFVPGPPAAEATGAMKPAPDASGGGQAGQGAQEQLDSLFKGELLRSEELDFQKTLKTPEAPAVTTPATASGATSTATQAAPGPARTAPSPAVESARTSNDVPTGNTVYEFIYQVAAYNQLHQAQNLAQKLNGGGIASQIELHKTSAATWYRVLVSFKGKEAEVQNFQQRLKQFNLSAPMLRKKKAISG